jgi:hypothetical protein
LGRYVARLVIPDADVDIIELGANARCKLYKTFHSAFDLLIGEKSVFERCRKALTPESIIAKQGVLLYGD